MRKASGGSSSSPTAAVSASNLAAAAAAQREPARHIDAVQFQAEYLKHQAPVPDQSPWETLADSELMHEVRLGLEQVLAGRPEFPVAALATFLKERRAQRHEQATQKAIVGGTQRMALDAKRDGSSKSSSVRRNPATKQLKSLEVTVKLSCTANMRLPTEFEDGGAQATAAHESNGNDTSFSPLGTMAPGQGISALQALTSREGSMRKMASHHNSNHHHNATTGGGSSNLDASGPTAAAASATASPLANDSVAKARKPRKARFTHEVSVSITPFPRSECADPDVLGLVSAWSSVSGPTSSAGPTSGWAKQPFRQCGAIPLYGMMKPSASALSELAAELKRGGYDSLQVIALSTADTVYIDGSPYRVPIREKIASSTGAVVPADMAVGWVIEALLEHNADAECRTVTEAVSHAGVGHHVKVTDTLSLRARPRSFVTVDSMNAIADFIVKGGVDAAVAESTKSSALVVISYVDDDALQQVLASSHCALASRRKAEQVARLRRADHDAISSRDVEREHHEAELRIQELRQHRRDLRERQKSRDDRRRKTASNMKLMLNGGHQDDGINRMASGSFSPQLSKSEVLKTLDALRTTADEREKRRQRNNAVSERMINAERSRAVLVIRGVVRKVLNRMRRRKSLAAAGAQGASPAGTASPHLSPAGLGAIDPLEHTGKMPPSPKAPPLSHISPASTGEITSPTAASPAPVPGSPQGPSSPPFPMLQHLPGRAACRYDTANEEFERDVNYAVIRVIIDECLTRYGSDAVMSDTALPPPMPRQLAVWSWRTKRIRPHSELAATGDECSSEDECWSADFNQRTYLPPLTTRHTHINPRQALVAALVECQCDWRRELFDARVLYSGVEAVQKRAMKQLGVTARMLLLTVYSFLRASQHPAVRDDANGGSDSSTLPFSEWVRLRHPRVAAFLRNPHVGASMVPEAGDSAASMRPDGPSDLQSYVLVRLPDAPLATPTKMLTPAEVAALKASQAQPAAASPIGASPTHNTGGGGGGGTRPNRTSSVASKPDQHQQPLAIDVSVSPAGAVGGPALDGIRMMSTATFEHDDANHFLTDVNAERERRGALYWYATDKAAAHLATPLNDLVLCYQAPKPTRNSSMLPYSAASAGFPVDDPAACFIARRLHPSVPVVIADVNATTKALHALAVTIATSPLATPLPPPSGHRHGSHHSGGIPEMGGSVNMAAGSLARMHQPAVGHQHGSLLLPPQGSNGTTPRSPNAMQSGKATPPSPGAHGPAAVPAANNGAAVPPAMVGPFVWWYAGKHPLVYVGGHPHAAVMRAARAKTRFASAHVTLKAAPQSNRKASSGVMNPRPPRNGITGPARPSYGGGGATPSERGSRGDSIQAELGPSAIPSSGASLEPPTPSHGRGGAIDAQQQQQQQPDDPVIPEHPAWPDAAVVPAPTGFEATVTRWGDAVSWPAIEDRLKTMLEADIASSDGLLFRYIIPPTSSSADDSDSPSLLTADAALPTAASAAYQQSPSLALQQQPDDAMPPRKMIATLDDLSAKWRRARLETAEIRPDVARVVKAKKLPPKTDDGNGGGGNGANDRRKTRHMSRSTASASAENDAMAKSTAPPHGINPAPPTTGGPHGSIRLERKSSLATGPRSSVTESEASRVMGGGGGGNAAQSKPSAIGAGKGPPPLPTNATDGLVQPLNEALQSVLTLPLTHAAVAGATSDGSAAQFPPQVVMRAPAFDSLDEHIDGISRVLAAAPRHPPDTFQPLPPPNQQLASAVSPRAAASSGSNNTSMIFPPVATTAHGSDRRGATSVFLVSSDQDLVLAAAATLAWCGWAAEPNSGLNGSAHPHGPSAVPLSAMAAGGRHGGGGAGINLAAPHSQQHQQADAGFRGNLMLKETMRLHGSDYTRPASAGEDGSAGPGVAGGNTFVPDVSAAAKTAARLTKCADGGPGSLSATSSSSGDLDDRTDDDNDDPDAPIDEVESEDPGSSDHRPLFATVTLRSRVAVDDFKVPAQPTSTHGSRVGGFGSGGSANANYLASGAGSPNNASVTAANAAAAAAAAEAEARRLLRYPSLQPLACLDALGVGAEFSAVDFSITEAQHVVTATLHRTGLYNAIRKPVDDLLEVERCALAAVTLKAPVPTPDELRRMTKAASQSIERYALLVFAQCYIASETWRDHPDKTFGDFLAYYPSLGRFLRRPDSLFACEIPLPVFSEGLYKEPQSPQMANGGANHRPGGLRQQPQSARGPAPASTQHRASLPQTARTVMMANSINAGLASLSSPREPPSRWPLVRQRVFPMDLASLLSAASRWDNGSVCHSLA